MIRFSVKRITVPLQGVLDGFCLPLYRVFTLECFFLLSEVSYIYTLSLYSDSRTHTQWFLRCIQAWPRVGFATYFNWDGGNSVLGVLEEAISRLSPLWGHTILTEWLSKQHVSLQPLPVSFLHHWTPSDWSEEELLLFYTSALLVVLSYSYKIPRGA